MPTGICSDCGSPLTMPGSRCADCRGGLEKGRQLRDEAIGNVALSHEEWLPMAKHGLWRAIKAAGPGGEITTDEVWRQGVPSPPEPRALGPVMMAAAKAGYIERTDRTRQTTRPEAHASPKRIWKVLK